MLDDNTLKIIKSNLNSYLPKNYKAFIFGSRATNNNRPFSDIDLGILGPKPVDRRKLNSLSFSLEDSNIPYIVDIVDFSTVSDKFKATALKKIIYI